MEYDTSEFQSSEIHDRNKVLKCVVGMQDGVNSILHTIQSAIQNNK